VKPPSGSLTGGTAAVRSQSQMRSAYGGGKPLGERLAGTRRGRQPAIASHYAHARRSGKSWRVSAARQAAQPRESRFPAARFQRCIQVKGKGKARSARWERPAPLLPEAPSGNPLLCLVFREKAITHQMARVQGLQAHCSSRARCKHWASRCSRSQARWARGTRTGPWAKPLKGGVGSNRAKLSPRSCQIQDRGGAPNPSEEGSSRAIKAA